LALGEQQKECKLLKTELMAFSAGITELDGRLAEMAEDRHLPQNQLKSAKMDLGRAEKQKEKLEGQIEERARQIEEMHNKLDGLDGCVELLKKYIHYQQKFGQICTLLLARKNNILMELETNAHCPLGGKY
jgi:chromosome segregation ATPase